MPGIVGVIAKIPPKGGGQQLPRMLEAIRHEPFYRTGTWANESLGAYVGWVAQKDSFSDGMPIRNERGDIALVFSGEEFPEAGTAQRLKERGHDLDVSGPAYLIHLYEEDPSFPAGLNGRFHGLLMDQNRRIAVLFNDRYGMHRIYYHESKDAFYFATEAKAILAVCPELRSMDPRGLGEFVACGCVMENRTLFVGIHVLPPASMWVFRGGSLDQRDAYFDPKEWEAQETLDLEAYYRELRHVFARNLPRYFNGPQRVAMSLTGGLDTRMIMAWHDAQPGSLPCYTFGGVLRECQDVTVARKVARVCGQSHQVVQLGTEFLSEFPRYAERAIYLSDGCVDVSSGVDVYLSQKEREIAPVRMTGNYGGEVLRRVRAFKPVELVSGLLRSEVLSYVLQANSTYNKSINMHPVSFAVFRQAPWHHHGVLAVEEAQINLRTPYLDNDIVQTLYRAPMAAFATSAICLRLIADGNPSLLQIPTDRGLAGKRGHWLGAIRHGFLEFLFKAEYAYDIGMPHWVACADRLLSLFQLEHLFLGRHKISRFRIWYRDCLAGYVREILLDRRSLRRPWVEHKRLEAVVESHLKGSHNYTIEIQKLLTLELIQRVFLEGHEVRSERLGAVRSRADLMGSNILLT